MRPSCYCLKLATWLYLISLKDNVNLLEDEHFRVFELASQTHSYFERKHIIKVGKTWL